MALLKARVLLLMEEEHIAELDKITGVKSAIEWGSQIRSYVLHPYTLVKDTRSNYEEGNVDKVLDDDLILRNDTHFDALCLRIDGEKEKKNFNERLFQLNINGKIKTKDIQT